LDNKINSFNAKDKRIANVLDSENLQDVTTKNYVDSLDSAIQDSLMIRIDNKIKNVPDPIDDGNAVNNKKLNEILNAVIYQAVLPPNSVD
jgi:hypothetical protein